MKKKFIVATGQLDSQGDIIMPGAIKKTTVPMTKDFKHDHVIGEAEVFQEGDVVKAEATIIDDYLDLYPAIGFQTIKSEKKGEVRELHEIRLMEISLCGNPNADPNVKKIRDQQD